MDVSFIRVALIVVLAITGTVSALLYYFSDDINFGKEGATVAAFSMMLISALLLVIAVLM